MDFWQSGGKNGFAYLEWTFLEGEIIMEERMQRTCDVSKRIHCTKVGTVLYSFFLGLAAL